MRFVISLALCLSLLTSPSLAAVEEHAQPVRVSSAMATPALAGGGSLVSAMVNGGSEDDRLVSIITPWATQGALHETVTDSQGVVRTLPALNAFEIHAHEVYALRPGNKHILLTGLTRDLRPGHRFPLILVFEKAGTVRVMVQITRH